MITKFKLPNGNYLVPFALPGDETGKMTEEEAKYAKVFIDGMKRQYPNCRVDIVKWGWKTFKAVVVEGDKALFDFATADLDAAQKHEAYERRCIISDKDEGIKRWIIPATHSAASSCGWASSGRSTRRQGKSSCGILRGIPLGRTVIGRRRLKMKFPSREQIERLRKQYPAGTIVELISMEDAQSPPPGTLGKIHGVDDAGSILVTWQNGSSLSLIPEVDSFRIVKEATDNE